MSTWCRGVRRNCREISFDLLRIDIKFLWNPYRLFPLGGHSQITKPYASYTFDGFSIHFSVGDRERGFAVRNFWKNYRLPKQRVHQKHHKLRKMSICDKIYRVGLIQTARQSTRQKPFLVNLYESRSCPVQCSFSKDAYQVTAAAGFGLTKVMIFSTNLSQPDMNLVVCMLCIQIERLCKAHDAIQ